MAVCEDDSSSSLAIVHEYCALGLLRHFLVASMAPSGPTVTTVCAVRMGTLKRGERIGLAHASSDLDLKGGGGDHYKPPCCFSNNTLAMWAESIASGMAYLARHGIVHWCDVGRNATCLESSFHTHS